LLSLAVTSNSTLVAGVPGDYVYFSADSGLNWTHLVSGLNNTAANTVLAFNGTVYVGLDAGYVATMSDASLSVQVASCNAMATENGVEVTWVTRSELNNDGFNILRKDLQSTYLSKIPTYLTNDSLRVLGTSSTGRTYSFTDTRVQSGQTYIYLIESVSKNGTKSSFGNLLVTV
jgi:hypothetical protein